MSIIRFLAKSIGVFIGGAASFFLLLFAIAALLCLLSVGLACAVFTAWAAVHYLIYLTMHDRQAGHHALHSILMAAGCFGFLVLTFSTVMDLFKFARQGRKPRLSLAITGGSMASQAVGGQPAYRSADGGSSRGSGCR